MPLENRKFRQRNSSKRKSNEDLQSFDDTFLKNGAANVIKLLIPLSLCMLMVVASLNSVPFFTRNSDEVYFDSHPLNFRERNESTFHLAYDAVSNALIFVGSAIVSTITFLTLYLLKFYKVKNYVFHVLFAFFLVTSIIIMIMLTTYIFAGFLIALNVPMDVFTTIIFLWNFCSTFITCTFWQGPVKVWQGYLIYMSAASAMMLIKLLPEWTTWVILFALSIWDLIAVLTPCGPLKKLIETAVERDDMEFPTLIYSTMVYGTTMTSTDADQNNDEPVEHDNTRSTDDEYDDESTESNEENYTTRSFRTKSRTSRIRKRSSKKSLVSERGAGFKLGLGDFVFYSVLVGKVSLLGENLFTTFACLLTVLMGLLFTLFLLTWFKRALPALPISIAFGMIFYFSFRYCVEPLNESLIFKQVFV